MIAAFFVVSFLSLLVILLLNKRFQKKLFKHSPRFQPWEYNAL